MTFYPSSRHHGFIYSVWMKIPAMCCSYNVTQFNEKHNILCGLHNYYFYFTTFILVNFLATITLFSKLEQ